jgi:hypothetical protein
MQEPQDSPPYYEGYPPQPPGPADRPRKRRGRRWLIALVVLVAIVVALDRIGVVVAESEMASKIQQEQKLAQKPTVSISGFPFLTQVASRDFSHVTVDIHGITASGFTISDLHADLTGVHVSSSFNSAKVDTLKATAALNYTDLDAALAKQIDVGSVKVTPGTGNELNATYDLLGVSVTASITPLLLTGNVLELKAGGISGPLGISVSDGFDYKYSLGSLPFGIQLTSLDVTSTEVAVSATGHNVPLSQTTSLSQ